MRHARRWLWFMGIGLVTAALLLAVGSRGGAPPFPTQPTQAEALSKVLNRPVQIAHSEPFDDDRALVLFRTDQHPGLSPTLLEQTWTGWWRMTDSVGLSPRLNGLGPLTYDRATVGQVTEKVRTYTLSRAEATVLYGEVLNPAITWVAITRDDGGTEAFRASVKDGIWLVKLPDTGGAAPQFILTAGNPDGRLFTATLASAPLDKPGEVAEFDDRLAGILLRSRYARYPRFDEYGYQFGFLDGRLSIRQAEPSGKTPQELLARFLSMPLQGWKVEVLEQGTGRLGGHDAALVWLSATGPAEKRQNKAVYLVATAEADYEVICASAEAKNPLPWEYLQPRCDQLLATLQLGR